MFSVWQQVNKKTYYSMISTTKILRMSSRLQHGAIDKGPCASGHMMRRVSLEKTLMLGQIEGRRRRGWQRTRWLGGIADSMDVSVSKLRELVKDREVWHAAVLAVAKSWTWLSDWTTCSWGFSTVTQVSDKKEVGVKEQISSPLPLLCPIAPSHGPNPTEASWWGSLDNTI